MLHSLILKFDNLVITYKNEKLVEATFTLFDNASVMDNPFKDRATILNEAKSKQNQIMNRFYTGIQRLRECIMF